MTQTDRSRYLELNRCSRARWFGYEIYGQGIDTRQEAPALRVGRAVHEGLASLLEHRDIQQALAYPVRLDSNAERRLVEGLLRGWAMTRMDDFLRTYEIIAIETEINVPLAQDLMFMSRPDGVLRHKETGDIHVLSFKTAAYYTAQTENQGFHDDQHLSESIAVAHAYNLRPAAVHMEYLVKGKHTKASDGVEESYDSPLVGGWVNWSDPRTPQYAGRFQTTGPDGRVKRLGKGWVRYVPEDIQEWLEWLQTNEPFTLAAQFIAPIEYPIDWAEVESWKLQVATQEKRIAHAAQATESKRETSEYSYMLDTQFPQNRRSCDWPGACKFQPICFGPVPSHAPIGEQYRLRIVNHPQEVEE